MVICVSEALMVPGLLTMGSVRWLFAVVAVLPTALAGCRDTPEAGLTPEERSRATEIGASAADAMLGTLSSRLVAALSQGGAAHAVVFCAGRAEDLTDSVTASLPDGIRVGRTSLRVRNPSNAPDALDRVVLGAWEEMGGSGRPLPAEEVRRGPGGEVRYYRPLIVSELCLGCHGEVEALSPDVRAVLAARYPDDRATGYRVGDLRGAARVVIPGSVLELP